MIQLINYSGQLNDIDSNKILVSKIAKPNSLDEFSVNIIDLSSPNLWSHKEIEKSSIDLINHFKSIKTMIDYSRKADNIIIFPQNERFVYNTYYQQFTKYCELKDMLPDLEKNIMTKLLGASTYDLMYENTKTRVGSKEIKASFYFLENNYTKSITKSIGSGKCTTIQFKNIILTTLNLTSQEDINAFLSEVGLSKNSLEIPKWMTDIQMFDDIEQYNLIKDNEHKIKKSNELIEIANKKMEKNNEFKSILYTNGDKLVTVVFDILQEIFGCDLSNFVDNKNEDFIFEIDGVVYIGEIKGVNHNVKSENISQLDVHYHGYIDEHSDIDPSKVKAILIMNHQKNKPLETREPVHNTQIQLAKRNGSLIVETITLLKLYEKYIKSDLNRDECIKLLSNNTGILVSE